MSQRRVQPRAVNDCRLVDAVQNYERLHLTGTPGYDCPHATMFTTKTSNSVKGLTSSRQLNERQECITLRPSEPIGTASLSRAPGLSAERFSVTDGRTRRPICLQVGRGLEMSVDDVHHADFLGPVSIVRRGV
jgi:hypothetical protein